MAKICPTHDVAYAENGSCWCCDQAKKKGTAKVATASTPVRRKIG